MSGPVGSEVICPVRVRRRTVSRGAIVRKKASRDQYEASTMHAWQRLKVQSKSLPRAIRSRSTWLASLQVVRELLRPNSATQVRTLAFKYTRRLQRTLSVPYTAVALL